MSNRVFVKAFNFQCRLRLNLKKMPRLLPTLNKEYYLLRDLRFCTCLDIPVSTSGVNIYSVTVVHLECNLVTVL